jgi:hypothetical protein
MSKRAGFLAGPMLTGLDTFKGEQVFKCKAIIAGPMSNVSLTFTANRRQARNQALDTG